MSAVMESLQKIVGDPYVTEAEHIRLAYSRGRGIFTQGRTPDVVVRPSSTEQVQAVMRTANDLHIPVYVCGASTRPFGYYAVKGGILLDTTRLNRLIKIDEPSLTCTIEPGITFGELDAALFKAGFEFLVSPMGSLGGTVGGHAAAHGVSSRCFLVENQGECVTGLKVVLPTGELVTTGALANPAAHSHFMRYSFMSDLTGLFLGSEGALGVIVEIGLKIEELPEASAHVMYGFDDPKAVARVIYVTRRKRVPALDVIVRHLSRRDQEQTGLQPPPKIAVGWMRLGGSQIAVDDGRRTIRDICLAEGGRPLPDEYAEYHWTNRWHPVMLPKESERAVREYEAFSFFPVCPLGEAESYLDIVNDVCAEMQKKYPEARIFDAMIIHPAGRAMLVNGSILCDDTNPRDFELAWRVFNDMKARLFERGVVPYNAAMEYFSDLLPRTGGYFKLLRSLKGLLDPNGIMSPGCGGL